MANPPGAPASGAVTNVDALKKVYLFASLLPQELKFLVNVVKRREFNQNSVVFREGDAAISLFIVESGKLRVVKANPGGGDPIVLTTLSAGTLFGEIPFVAGGTRTANIMSLDFAIVYEISYDQLEQLAQLNPQFGLKLYKQLALYMAKSLKATTLEMAAPKPDVVAAARTRTGNTAFIQRPSAGPMPDAPGAKLDSAGEIVIEIDEDDK